MAARLSENPDINVTVLEAGSGPFHDKNIDIPGRLMDQHTLSDGFNACTRISRAQSW